MTYNFCTFFDSNYLLRGLALHQSLARVCPDFRLWVLCMDQRCHDLLAALDLPGVRLMGVAEFEAADPEIAAARADRTAAEHFFTCTPAWTRAVLELDPTADHVCYLDSDLYFFADPEPIYAEFAAGSVLIHPHRYAPRYAKYERGAGTYNVGLVMFRNDPAGRECLDWWRRACLTDCTLDLANGKCGDQSYLNDWPQRFAGMVILEHKGGGLAPWNIDNHALGQRQGRVWVDEQELIFYHYQALALVRRAGLPGVWAISADRPSYNFSPANLGLIYRPYLAALARALAQVQALDPGFDVGLVPRDWGQLWSLWRQGKLLRVRE